MPEWTDLDIRHMHRALKLAAKGQGRVEPNPMVGAVVVKNGKVIGEGFHQLFGGPHAEVNAIKNAGAKAKGSTVYVTLEPCNHFGKTPPCTQLLIKAGVSRVVSAMTDPDERVSGRGFETLKQAGIKVENGLLEDEARKLNAPYLTLRNQGRPFIIAKWAMTLDGQIATFTGDSKWVTGEKARRHVHQVRDRVDAILIGIGTAQADDPLLTCRLPSGRNPLRIVLDSHARLSLNSNLVRTTQEAGTLVVTTDGSDERCQSLESAGCEVMKVRSRQGKPSLRYLLNRLGQRQITNLLVEGGRQVLGAFFREKLVDKVMVYQSPKIIGDGLSPVAETGWHLMSQAARLQNVTTRRFGEDLLVEGLVM
ncbi:MAG: bifunctional diaminohydroxyphosphoribosylaminopyrimidine deaminase/5-amino-6-(5-phosphoribosylamino)uracil reductase RibD [Planctomycetota bacterium]|nr:bifunctional diaminohydroxyphosphoribosylaminopyrimidine deaminase/5-amino-6-(5-phosphoribosylamino)uracil reductase RibD [Planctomycetota bacterium]MDA1139710.1 bifunctional diaminohydroxyphosphoribosylaminopyrimidine deaminase/5-amino-6-(5-phosphoribosylamino)uracil reductase RibD [Planctomycetota bacterium]